MHGKFTVRSVALNAGSLAAGEIACRLVSLVLVMIASRKLGPSQMGIYAFCVSLTGNFLVLLNFGFDPFVSRELARDPAVGPSLLVRISLVKFALFAVCIPIAAIVAMSRQDSRETVLILTMTGSVFVASHLHSAYAFFRASMRAWKQSLTSLGQRLAVSLVGIALVLNGFGVVALATTELIVGVLCLLIVAAVHFRPAGAPITAARPREWIDLVRITWPFAAYSISVNVFNSVDLLMLPWLSDAAATGYFSSAEKLGMLVGFVPNAMAGTVLPVIARISQEGEKSHSRSIGYYLKLQAILGGAFCTLFVALAADLPGILFGNEFLPIKWTVVILAPGMVILFVNQALSVALVTSDRERRMLKVFIFCALLNIALNALLIPYWRDKGAAATTLFSSVVLILLQYRGLDLDRRKSIGLWSRIAAPLVSAAFGLGASLLVMNSELHILIKGSIGLSGYLGVLVLTGALGVRHLGLLRHLRKGAVA